MKRKGKFPSLGANSLIDRVNTFFPSLSLSLVFSILLSDTHPRTLFLSLFVSFPFAERISASFDAGNGRAQIALTIRLLLANVEEEKSNRKNYAALSLSLDSDSDLVARDPANVPSVFIHTYETYRFSVRPNTRKTPPDFSIISARLAFPVDRARADSPIVRETDLSFSENLFPTAGSIIYHVSI